MTTSPAGRPESDESGRERAVHQQRRRAAGAHRCDNAPLSPINASGRAYTATASSGSGSESTSLSGNTQFSGASSAVFAGDHLALPT